MARLIGMHTHDVRFPTSRTLDGSDAMNPDPDYSAAYLRLLTDADDGLEGHGFVFTIGRGNDAQVAALRVLESHLVGREVEPMLADLGGVWRELVHDSQLRWLGPEKGIMHMAIGAVINALWDLRAKREGKPLWQLLASLTPEEIVDLVDFRYLTDALTPQEALGILRAAQAGRAERRARLLSEGYPAYTTTPGWLGYDDDKLARLCREAVAEGFTQIKLKVGSDLDDDVRRLGIAREACGPGIRIAVDANQRWDVPDAIRWIRALRPFDIAWVEEPTSPDDVLGHAAIARAVAPIPVATGEHCANRVLFKQFLQAKALSVLQLDATRVAGVNENIAILLLAAKFGVPVCPHAGGVGLCEAVQHLAMFDYVAVSGSTQNRMIEFVDHLHEHFVTPVDVRGGRYYPPGAPGAGTQMLGRSLLEHSHDLERSHDRRATGTTVLADRAATARAGDPATTPEPVLDTHLHLWDLTVSAYAWLPADGPLHASFTAEQARSELDAAGIGQAVLVQAEDSEADTEFMLAQAARHDWISGVVGWVRLDDPDTAAGQLDRWQQHPAFSGVRHLVHDDARADFLELPAVRRSLAMLARRGLPFDVPDAWPRHLAGIAALADALPELTIVVDHLGKPPPDPEAFTSWRATLRAVAARPNVVAKVSGLQVTGAPFTVTTARPAVEAAFELFGPERLMYGGDWPMTLQVGGYGRSWEILSTLIGELSGAERSRVLSGTGSEVYGLRERVR